MNITIGTRLKELRKNKNISQEELANELNVSRQTISKWESDIVSPDIKNIETICKYFNVSADYLINGKNLIKKQNNIWIIICFVMGLITIITTSILLIINNGNESPSSTINISYEFILLFIGILMTIMTFIYWFKTKKS